MRTRRTCWAPNSVDKDKHSGRSSTPQNSLTVAPNLQRLLFDHGRSSLCVCVQAVTTHGYYSYSLSIANKSEALKNLFVSARVGGAPNSCYPINYRSLRDNGSKLLGSVVLTISSAAEIFAWKYWDLNLIDLCLSLFHMGSCNASGDWWQIWYTKQHCLTTI